MNKRTTILLIGVLIIALPGLAIMKSNSYKYENTLGSEKCSSEIEKLKLCVENPKVVVNSGEQIRIKLFWVNTSNLDRRIGRGSSGYSVTVTDENGKKLIPVFEQRFIEKKERIRKSGEEDKGVILRTFSGSDRGLYAEANGTEKDEVILTDKMYDYDLLAKGKYYVRIEKTTPSSNGKGQSTFVLDNVEIQVK